LRWRPSPAQVLEPLDNPHRAQRVGHHHADELFGRNIGDGFPVVVRHARIDEHEIKTIRPKTSAQGRNLSGIVDVDGLDVEPAISLADKIVQSGFRPITHGGDHTPAELQVLFRYRQPETAGSAEKEKTFFRC